jgi:uncharacterized Zn-finger protein
MSEERNTFSAVGRSPQSEPPKPKMQDTQIQPDQVGHPIIADALRKNMAKNEDSGFNEAPRPKPVQQSQPYVPGPKIAAFSNNDDLNALLDGIREYNQIYTEVQLPSLGKFYQEGEAPSNGIVNVRQMTGEEEELIGTTKLHKNDKWLINIFRACVKEPIVPEKLLWVDRVALLVYIRGITLGRNYEVEIKCPACNNKFEHVIDLDREVVACPEDLNPETTVGVLPVSGYRFSYRFETMKDVAVISDYWERKSKISNEQSPNDSAHFKASLLINYIEDPKTGAKITDSKSIKTLISRLPYSDSTYIKNVFDETPFGMNTECDVECPLCSELFKMEMPMGINFFFPDRIRQKKRSE